MIKKVLHIAYRYGGGSLGIKKYWYAAEMALDAYKNGTIQELIEQFFVSRNSAAIEDVAVDTQITDENKNVVLTKYIGLVRYSDVAVASARYSWAAGDVYGLQNDTQTARKISAEYKQDMADLQTLARGGQTAKKLYGRGQKDLALVKWIADSQLQPPYSTGVVKDKYVSMMSVVRGCTADENCKKILSERRAELETAIKNHDKSTEMVTIQRTFPPVLPLLIGAIVVGIVVSGGVYFWRRKKSADRGRSAAAVLFLIFFTFARLLGVGMAVEPSDELIQALRRDVDRTYAEEGGKRTKDEILKEKITVAQFAAVNNIALEAIKKGKDAEAREAIEAFFMAHEADKQFAKVVVPEMADSYAILGDIAVRNIMDKKDRAWEKGKPVEGKDLRPTLSEAQKNYLKAIKINPQLSYAVFNLGTLEIMVNNDKQKGNEYIIKAFEMNEKLFEKTKQLKAEGKFPLFFFADGRYYSENR
ncbi:MAG: hypothetical protein HY265_04410 [Deltaproteobacteria bacterium]|nr:hypothetical protein [Deltaproteobacteria bacterium]